MQGMKVFLSVVAHRWIRVSVSHSGTLISVMVEASRSAEAAPMRFLVMSYTSDPIFTSMLLFLSQIINQ